VSGESTLPEAVRWPTCFKCKTRRPPSRLVPLLEGHPEADAAARLGGVTVTKLRCCDKDVAFCSKAAGVGLGRLDADTGGA